MNLRIYQVKALEVIWTALQWEHSVLLEAACSAGKTLLFSKITRRLLAENPGFRVLILMDREVLVSQTREKLLYAAPELALSVGTVCASVSDVKTLCKPITIASRQSLINQLNRFASVNLIIVDECFVPGTLIDGKPIKEIIHNDMVSSFNHTSGRIEGKRVVAISKRQYNGPLYQISTNRQTVICTENHPFFVDNEYIPAYKIRKDDKLSTILCGVQNGKEKKGWNVDWATQPDSDSQLRAMRKTNDSKPFKSFSRRCRKKDFLFYSMSSKLVERDDASATYNLQRKNESKQPGLARWSERKGESYKTISWHIECYQKISRRKRTNPASSANAVINSFRLGYGGAYYSGSIENSSWYEANVLSKQGITHCIQSGYSQSRFEDSDRDRRQFTSSVRTQKTGYKETKLLGIERVASVEVYQYGSPEWTKFMHGENYVYNLEVKDNNNYFANGILVHNCHLMAIPKEGETEPPDQFNKIINALREYNPKTRLLGVTATPYRLVDGYIYGSKNAPGCLPRFETVHHRITVGELLKEGFLAPLVGKTVVSDGLSERLKDVSIVAGEYNLGAISGIMTEGVHVRSAVQAWKEYAHDRKKTIAFGVTIAHAEKLAQAFNAAGISALAIHSEMDDLENYAAMNSLRNGEHRVFCSVGKLTTGLDVPDVDAIIMARPTKSAALYKQILGRGMRTAPEKRDCLVLDMVGNNHEFGTDLDRLKVRYRTRTDPGGQPIMKNCPNCEADLHPAVRVCPDCGYEYPVKDFGEADRPDMVDTDYGATPSPETLRVTNIYPSIHIGKGSGKSLLRIRIEFEGLLESVSASLWLCFAGDGYEGYAVEKGKTLWKTLTMGDINYPYTAEEAVSRKSEIKMPQTCIVDLNGRWPEIKEVGEVLPF